MTMSDKICLDKAHIGIFTYFAKNADFSVNKTKFHSFFT